MLRNKPMPPKKNVPDGPRPKRAPMTPEQLEKLALARDKAAAVRQAMKSENDEHKIRILQAKMDARRALDDVDRTTRSS